ncbi:cytochrome P450 [Epithele typhae]|uniref:cytochrome P450 n=1 Tax=Epithele typhae TaxID=378194 RepID=UPI00200736A1|nr:cytochrome P450 [Epithele typhae]KAH9911270.1 cytochrome P450 [Epithele typhae]
MDALNSQSVLYTFSVAAVIALVALKWLSDPRDPNRRRVVAPGLSYFSALRFLHDGKIVLAEGYQKYYGRPFKVATPDRWAVIVSGPEMTEDLRTRPDDEMSFLETAEDNLHTHATIGRQWIDDPYQFDLVRGKLTRSLPAIVPDVVQEISLVVPQFIPAKGDEWAAVTMFPTAQKIVARLSNRVFVGTPLCRNEEFLDLTIQFVREVLQHRAHMKKFPFFLKPLAGLRSGRVKAIVERAVTLLAPIVEQRMAELQEHGADWDDKPNDMLTWILEESIPRRTPLAEIVQRVLMLNFVATNTTSQSATHALFHLAADPALLAPLRAEAAAAVAAHGWTKAGLGRLWRLDSLMRESQRTNGVSLLSVMRKALKDLTLRDGTSVPRGTLVAVPALATHLDAAVNGAGADAFEPFRWAEMRGEDAGEGVKHQFVNTSPLYIPFGHGRHACPGRFFAATQMKALLAHLIVHYDMEIVGGGGRPANEYFAEFVMPDGTAQIRFRERRDVPAGVDPDFVTDNAF